jgi:hypothetical protein
MPLPLSERFKQIEFICNLISKGDKELFEKDSDAFIGFYDGTGKRILRILIYIKLMCFLESRQKQLIFD